eukprot:m.51623 g.51623  ORF g.51623 m.51623 type:complete len:135 (-) comp11716_c0_seq2:177-581(-)
MASIAQYSSAHTVRASLLTQDLPENVHLLSLNAIDTGATTPAILRLQHVFPVGEHPTLSQPVSVDLSTLFSTVSVQSATQTTLTANQPLTQVRRPAWPIEGETPTEPAPVAEVSNVVVLKPRDLLTFVVNLAKK